jgi:hypothetical protein
MLSKSPYVVTSISTSMSTMVFEYKALYNSTAFQYIIFYIIKDDQTINPRTKGLCKI